MTKSKFFGPFGHIRCGRRGGGCCVTAEAGMSREAPPTPRPSLVHPTATRPLAPPPPPQPGPHAATRGASPMQNLGHRPGDWTGLIIIFNKVTIPNHEGPKKSIETRVLRGYEDMKNGKILLVGGQVGH